MCECSGSPEFFVPFKLALGAKPIGIAKRLVEAVYMSLILNKSLLFALEAYRDLRKWKE